ncbi:hypothetical protein Gpo141_00013033, partial [Globisporangium polare]
MLRGSSDLVLSLTSTIASAANASSNLTVANETAATVAGIPSTDEPVLAKASSTAHMLLVFFLLQFAVIWLLCVTLVIHLRYNRAAAFKGDDAAARKIILPAFEPLLIVLGGFNFICMLFMAIVMATEVYDKSVPNLVLEGLYSAEQFDVTLVMVFMLQKSVSIPALKRAVVIATVLSGYSVPYMWVVLTYGDPSKQILFVKWLHVVHSLVLVLAIHMIIWPPTRASSRTLRELAVYDIVRHALTLVTLILVMNPATLDKGIYPFYVMLAWVAFNPLVIWRVLKADTGYWRGMGQRACAL